MHYPSIIYLKVKDSNTTSMSSFKLYFKSWTNFIKKINYLALVIQIYIIGFQLFSAIYLVNFDNYNFDKNPTPVKSSGFHFLYESQGRKKTKIDTFVNASTFNIFQHFLSFDPFLFTCTRLAQTVAGWQAACEDRQNFWGSRGQPGCSQ